MTTTVNADVTVTIACDGEACSTCFEREWPHGDPDDCEAKTMNLARKAGWRIVRPPRECEAVITCPRCVAAEKADPLRDPVPAIVARRWERRGQRAMTS